jgi:hypothetical protein
LGYVIGLTVYLKWSNIDYQNLLWQDWRESLILTRLLASQIIVHIGVKRRRVSTMVSGGRVRRYFIMAFRYGMLWFLYGQLPKHASSKRANWSKYLDGREVEPTPHKAGFDPYTVDEILRRLQVERMNVRMIGYDA